MDRESCPRCESELSANVRGGVVSLNRQAVCGQGHSVEGGGSGAECRAAARRVLLWCEVARLRVP